MLTIIPRLPLSKSKMLFLSYLGYGILDWVGKIG